MSRAWLFLPSVSLLLAGCPDDPAGGDETSETGADSTSNVTTADDGPTTGVDDGSGTVDPSADSTDDNPTTDDPTTSPDTTNATDDATTDATTGTTGTPEPPEIDVTVDDVAVDSGDTVAIDTTVDVGASLTAIAIVVTNTGAGTLNITGVSSVGGENDFVVDDGDLPAMLATDETVQIDLTFSPISGGSKTIELTLANDDADENPFTLTFDAHTTPQTFRQITTTTTPTARFNSAMATLSDGRILMFGGRDNSNTRLGDTWIFDPDLDDWTDITPGGTSPPIRDAHEMVYLEGSDTVLLFGGNTVNGGDATGLGDTWSFDVATETWSQLLITSPGPRFQHMMVSLGDDALMYGGRSGFTHLDTTRRYLAASNNWIDPSPSGSPPSRITAAFAYDGNGTAVLYGGFVDNNPLATTYVYSTATNTWSQQFTATNPGARGTLEGVFLDDGTMTVFSGKLDSCCNDPDPGTWNFDPSGPTWTEITTNEPAPRYNYSWSAIPGDNRAILFGGQLLNAGAGSAVQETWEYVGAVP